VLAACCASPRWASAVAAGRPYASPEQLFDAADDALADLDEDDVSRALAGHPRIGERAEGEGGAWSRREQSGLSGAEPSTLQAMAEANRLYESRFGQVYLVCASGRSAEELLAVLRQRLRNDPVTERAVVRRELGLINRIRLCRLVEDTAA
jgi:2-oxo-4-hydroxy-4-carboxy-5-ureidoimidazoline decarboxylase